MSKTGTLSAGDRIDTKCSRCSDITGHIIVAMVGSEIIKVECQACGSTHKYRETRAPKSKAQVSTVKKVRGGDSRKEAISAARSAAAKKAAQTRAAQRAKQEAEAVMIAWKTAMVAKGSDGARSYNMNETFTKGDVVQHPTFGMGEVQTVTKPNKMEVLFEDGVKVLRCRV
ncbi:MAG: hypothetical protein MI749_02750 [Desulfovibrionales bacterium]|nr:hypothetical protein [Desulfovibrionales bacterium]